MHAVKASELREKSDEELRQIAVDLTDDLMHFRLQAATGVVDNVKLARTARRDIARIKTILGERARAAAGTGAAD
jgi:large subunit ribosomal protein L29